MIWTKLKKYGELVMFSHTLFSLPFALVAMVWAAEGLPDMETIFWILVALLGARNGANAFNRFADRNIDKKNPRTADRHIPAGTVKTYEALGLAIFGFCLLLLAAFMLNPLCVVLLPGAILLFIIYSYSKRFTWLCHIILGVACGGAPVGAWIAVRGRIDWPILVLGAVVTCWVAGFDIIYGTQDIDFDRKEGLFSMPAKFGLKYSLWISTILHGIAVALLIYLYILLRLNWIYLIGIGLISLLLFIEHNMVSPSNRKTMKIASYSINQVISMIFLVFSLVDYFFLK